MQKNSEDFSMQEALRLAKSPAGQQLLAVLRQTDNARLQNILEQASAGNYAQAKAALDPLLASEEAQELLKQLGR